MILIRPLLQQWRTSKQVVHTDPKDHEVLVRNESQRRNVMFKCLRCRKGLSGRRDSLRHVCATTRCKRYSPLIMNNHLQACVDMGLQKDTVAFLKPNEPFPLHRRKGGIRWSTYRPDAIRSGIAHILKFKGSADLCVIGVQYGSHKRDVQIGLTGTAKMSEIRSNSLVSTDIGFRQSGKHWSNKCLLEAPTQDQEEEIKAFRGKELHSDSPLSLFAITPVLDVCVRRETFEECGLHVDRTERIGIDCHYPKEDMHRVWGSYVTPIGSTVVKTLPSETNPDTSSTCSSYDCGNAKVANVVFGPYDEVLNHCYHTLRLNEQSIAASQAQDNIIAICIIPIAIAAEKYGLNHTS